MQTIKTSLKRAAAVAGLATIGLVLGTPAASACHNCNQVGGVPSVEAPHDHGTGVDRIAGVGGTLALAAGGTLVLRNRRRTAAEQE